MRLSTTLSIYIGRRFILSFMVIFIMLLTIILLLDTVELLRRAAAKPDVEFGTVLKMALLKLPHMGQKLFPFAVLFGGMLAFWGLTRNSELVITRAAGVSAWQFLMPVLLIAFFLGIFNTTVISPLSSAMLARFERIEATALRGQRNYLAISENGLWLRQSSKMGQSVVHSKSIIQQGKDVELRDVIVFMYQGKDRFFKRIDAETAKLEDGFWHMRKVWMHDPEKQSKFLNEYWLETDLTVNSIQDSFAPPETMSFWNIREFINNMEKAGFSAVRHRLYWYSLLAAPLLMCAMVLIAATFTLRQARRGGTSFIIASGVMTGFMLYFFSDVVYALGLSDSIPVALAAWTPSGVATMLGVAMLLHLEDG